MPRQKKYPEELLDRGARMVFDSGRPTAHVARDLGVHHETLRKWVRKTEADEGKRSELLSSEEREPEDARAREPRTAPGQRDPQVRLSVFRRRARPTPNEVSAFIEEHRQRFGVEPICKTLEVSASAYYERAKGNRSARAIGTSACWPGSRRSTRPTTPPTATGAPGSPCAGPARR